MRVVAEERRRVKRIGGIYSVKGKIFSFRCSEVDFIVHTFI